MSREKFRTWIGIEKQRIEKELKATEPLRNLLVQRSPDEVELRAVASVLHAVYNGLEAVLKKVASETGNTPGDRSRWHKDLLQICSSLLVNGNPLLPLDILRSLEELLAFRHFFRNAYGNELNWDLMRPLWFALPDTIRMFFDSLDPLFLLE